MMEKPTILLRTLLHRYINSISSREVVDFVIDTETDINYFAHEILSRANRETIINLYDKYKVDFRLKRIQSQQSELQPQPKQEASSWILPRELLCNIYSFLDTRTFLTSIPKVCRDWFESIFDPDACKTLNMSDLPVDNIHKYLYVWKNIHNISLRGCTSESSMVIENLLKNLLNNCIYLESLNLSWVTKISDQGLVYLSNGINLQYLNLSWNLQITDCSIFSVSKCTKLITLDLSWCMRLTDTSLQYISSDCHLLLHLNLCRCRKITDVGLKFLAEGCQKLINLDLCGVSQITDNGINYLTSSCHSIQTLNLWWCSEISDTCLKLLVQGCCKLVELNVLCCPNLTDIGILELLNLENFMILRVDSCCISDKTQKKLKNKFGKAVIGTEIEMKES